MDDLDLIAALNDQGDGGQVHFAILPPPPTKTAVQAPLFGVGPSAFSSPLVTDWSQTQRDLT